MMPCPRCGGTNTASLSRSGNRRPRLVGRAIIRQHRCLDCGLLFRSYQFTANDRQSAEAIEDAIGDVA